MNRSHNPDRTPTRRPRNAGPTRNIKPYQGADLRENPATTLDDLEARAWRNQSWTEFTRLSRYYDLDDPSGA